MRNKLIRSGSALTKRFFLSAVLLASGQLALALPGDENQPIEIESNTAFIDDRTGIIIYRGNVLVVQGSMKITADRLTLTQQNRSINRIEATGSPVHFQQQLDTNGLDRHAWGNKLTYQVDKDTLILEGSARVESGRDTFSGERVVYDLKRSLLDAYGASNENSSGRVKMVIQPKGGSN